MDGKPLNDTFIKSLKGVDPKKFFDGGGLYLYLTPTGTKLWRLSYRFNGKPKTLSFGPYPILSLKDARDKRDAAKRLLLDGIDPSEQKKSQEAEEIAKNENTFERIGREWHENKSVHLAETTRKKIISTLEKDAFPYIGHIPITELTAPDILQVCRRVEARGASEIAHRVLQNSGQIMRYAIATGRGTQDVTAFLKGALKPMKSKHYPTITEPKKVGELMRAIESYQGHFTVACALKLLPLVFVRPGELRKAEWSEFNLEAREWRIPAERMKMDEQHIVPLSNQAMAILQYLHKVTGADQYLFPSIRTTERPMSDNTINSALRRLGYTKDEICPHGFRAMASTLLNELGYNRDWIERQLSHGERDAIRAAYNHAEFLPERRKMMQEWADYLHNLKNGNTER